MVIGKYALEIISIVLILVLTPILFPANSTLFIYICFLCVVSRSNLIYHSMNLEVHSFFMIFMAILYGPWVCIYTAIITTWLARTLSNKIGQYNPILTLMDTGHMIFIGLCASLMTIEGVFIPAMIVLFIAEFFRNGVRFFTYHESPIKYAIMGTFFMFAAYFALGKFAYLFIQAVGGTV